jgi:hypothetical protein
MRVGTVACVNTRGRRCRLVILPWCIKVSEDGLAVMTLLRSPTHSVAKGVDRTYRRHAKSRANEPERTLLDPLGNEIIRFKIVSIDNEQPKCQNLDFPGRRSNDELHSANCIGWWDFWIFNINDNGWITRKCLCSERKVEIETPGVRADGLQCSGLSASSTGL